MKRDANALVRWVVYGNRSDLCLRCLSHLMRCLVFCRNQNQRLILDMKLCESGTLN
jgi:hypothetical protein